MRLHVADETDPAIHFVNLVMNRIQLMVPQSEIHSLESVADMLEADPNADHSVGRFEKRDQAWPVYVLSADLTPQLHRPEEYRTAVLMKNGKRSFGLLCKQARRIECPRSAIHPLPDCMRQPNSPFLALLGDQLQPVSSVKTLSNLLAPRLPTTESSNFAIPIARVNGV